MDIEYDSSIDGRLQMEAAVVGDIASESRFTSNKRKKKKKL